MINFWFHVFSSDNTFHIEIFQCNLYLTSYGSTKKGNDVSKKLYSKLKVAHKNAKKWTKTVFFKYEPAHKAGKMRSLEMTPYFRGRLSSDCGPMIFGFLVKFWWRKIYCWKINIKFQRYYKSNQKWWYSQKCITLTETKK